MVTSIFFTTNQIQVLQGKINKEILRVTNIYTEPLEKGSLINGVITDESAVLRSMESLFSRTKLQKEKFDLIVDSGSVLTKHLDVPILPSSKLKGIAKSEFVEAENNHEDLLYDFGVINRLNPNQQGGSILCAAMESSLAFSYIDLFKRMKLRLRSIDLALSSQIALVRYLPEMAERTFILAFFDGNSLVSSLYEKGQYLFSNRIRLLAQSDEEDFAEEVAATISSLIQFHRTQKKEEDLSNIYFCGFPEEEKELYTKLSERLFVPTEALPNSPAVWVESTSEVFRLSDYFCVTGNLLIKDGAYHG